MSSSGYERVSGQDQSLLAFEDTHTQLHVAVILILEAGPLAKPDGGIEIERIRAYTASQLHRLPRYRQRLAYALFDQGPVWIDDEHFNLDYHVRHTSLPRPGDERQLKRLVGRILSQRLDRERPLWEIWVVEGLENNRFALIAKTHPCVVEGPAAVDLLAVLLRPEPEVGESGEGTPFQPRPAPGQLYLIRDELIRRARSPFGLVEGARRLLDEPGQLGSEIVQRVRKLAGTLGGGPPGVGETPINRAIGPHRRFDSLSMNLADVREVKSGLGGTVHDIVLATVTGAVRSFFEQRGTRVDASRFEVVTPVSTHPEDGQGAPGARSAPWLVELPVSERDPRLVLEQIREATTELQETRQMQGEKLQSQAGQWTGSTQLLRAVQLLHGRPAFNLVVTHVPGPRDPLFLLGSPLRECYPQMPLFQNQGLGIALFSYAGRLFWGFSAEWDLLSDLSLFADGVVASFNELRAVAGPRTSVPRPLAIEQPVARA